MPNFLDAMLHKPQALTYHANQVKRRGQQAGATVQIARIQRGDDLLYIAGINSSANWRKEQRELLRSWGVTVVPAQFAGEMTLEHDGGAPHAEENMAAYIASVGAQGLRWSRAVVGAHYDTRQGSRSYVCHACRLLIGRVGGSIEPPW